MAKTDSSLNQVGPAAAQLKQNLSSLEKNQIASLKNLGSVSIRPNVITGSVSKSISSLSATQISMMQIGADLSSKLETAGAFNKTSEEAMRPAITSTVYDKTPLPNKMPIRKEKNSSRGRFRKSTTEVIKEKKEELVGLEDFNYAGLQFPSNLIQDAASYVQLEFHKYTRGDPQSEGSISPGLKIFLPVPENLSIGYNMRFEERDTDMLGEAAKSGKIRDTANAVKNGNLDAVKSMITDSTAAEVSDALATVASRAAFAALNSASETMGGLVGQELGMIANPHPTVFFKGLDLRQFTWTWKFVPTSAEDAGRLQAILFLIRKHILPKKKDGGNTFLEYPHLLKPAVKDIHGGNLALYGQFKRSAVKEFLVNYTAEGTSAYFVDGNPVAINCQMTFQEVENYTADDA